MVLIVKQSGMVDKDPLTDEKIHFVNRIMEFEEKDWKVWKDVEKVKQDIDEKGHRLKVYPFKYIHSQRSFSEGRQIKTDTYEEAYSEYTRVKNDWKQRLNLNEVIGITYQWVGGRGGAMKWQVRIGKLKSMPTDPDRDHYDRRNKTYSFIEDLGSM